MVVPTGRATSWPACTTQLTVHYKRGLYVLEDSVDNRRLRGTSALVSEDADGTVTIQGGHDRVLPYWFHHTDQAQLVPGVVVEHQHLRGETRMGDMRVPVARFMSFPPSVDTTASMSLLAGQSAGLVTDVKPAAVIVREPVEGARRIVAGL
jgi:hypothetical protein